MRRPDTGIGDAAACTVLVVLGTCVGPSEPSGNRRDTDWYRIPSSVMADHDFDGNGVVGIRARYVNTEFDAVTFLMRITDPAGACDPDVLWSVGCNALGGGVNVSDFLLMLALWGPCRP